MKILYIEDDLNIAEIYSLMIKERFPSCEIYHYLDGLEGIKDLKNNLEKYSLVISDFNLPNINGGEIFKFVNGQMLGIPFIILSGVDCARDENLKNFFDSHVRNAVLLKPVSVDELTEKIAWCMAGENNLYKVYQKEKNNFDEKIHIRSDVFMKLNSVPCDVFLKLNDGKYIKVIKKNELFETKLIQKLILKGITLFYVNRSEISKYSESVLDSLHSIIKIKKNKIDEFQKSQLTNKAMDVLKSNLLKCGFSDTVLQVTDDVVNLQLDMIKTTHGLESFLEKYQNFSKMNTDHSRIVSYIVVAILKELAWDSESTLHRMTLATLLHDISLSDDFLKKIMSDSEIEKLNEEDKKIYYNHSEVSSHLSKNFETGINGLDQIILEHHELPDGKGFPKKLNFNHVHPLSATLHVADFAADLLWEYDFDVEKVKEALNIKKSFYSRGFYRKPFEGLLKALKK